jgi:hypothetical protein
MSFAIFNLLSNIFTTGFACIGVGTVINKCGKFFKIINENKKDGFKNAFDTIMLDTVEEMNKCVESISVITSNSNKIIFTIYDISVGNKFIKKDKDGKIIICNKSKIYSGYKNKLEELSSKVKKYQEELSKIKGNKNNNDDNDDSLMSNKDSDDLSSDTENKKSEENNSSDISEISEGEEFYLGE